MEEPPTEVPSKFSEENHFPKSVRWHDIFTMVNNLSPFKEQFLEKKTCLGSLSV